MAHFRLTPVLHLRVQGYVAEKVSMLMWALRSALKRVGLVVETVDDSLPASEHSLPASEQHSPTAAGDTNIAMLGSRTQSGGHLGPIKIPGIHSLGEPIERMFHDAAEYHDSKAMHVAHEAMEGGRVSKNRIAM